MKKLFLLDGMALIYRAHFALSKTPALYLGGAEYFGGYGFYQYPAGCFA
jgi:DNA polymerase-1